MNDNELSMTPFWARQFAGCSEESLLAALGVLAGLIDSARPFENAAYAVQKRKSLHLGRTTVNHLLMNVANRNRLTVDDLLGPSRKYRVSRPRHEVMFRAFVECPHLSYAEIGRRIGGRDHTTIMHGVRAECKRRGLTIKQAEGLRRACRDRLEGLVEALSERA